MYMHTNGLYALSVVVSFSFVPSSSSFPSLSLSLSLRFPYARDFPFNNVLFAFITLFELLTLEGWIEVRDMFRDDRSELVNRIHL